MKQRIPKAIYSKEFREQVVKQVTEERLASRNRRDGQRLDIFWMITIDSADRINS